MKVVAFCGSARKAGNTNLLLKAVLKPLAEAGAETELVELARSEIRGCIACYVCFLEKNGTCILKKDMVNDCIAKMSAADAILLGSPTYFSDVSSEMKALIDRCGMVSQANGDMFKRKLGAAVVAAGRGGVVWGASGACGGASGACGGAGGDCGGVPGGACGPCVPCCQ